MFLRDSGFVQPGVQAGRRKSAAPLNFTTRASPNSKAVLIFYLIVILYSFHVALHASCEKVKDC